MNKPSRFSLMYVLLRCWSSPAGMSFSRTLTSASPNVKIGCRAYLCEARRALSEPVVDPMYVLSHFALSQKFRTRTLTAFVLVTYPSLRKYCCLLLRFSVTFERPYVLVSLRGLQGPGCRYRTARFHTWTFVIRRDLTK